MDGRDGRLSAAYLQEVLSLVTGAADEVPAERHARVEPDYPSVDLPPPQPVAVPPGVHGRLARSYTQAVAEFLANP
jgi:hypothetical protein